MKLDNFKKYRLIYITSIIISLIFIVIMNTALFKQLVGITVYVLLMVAFVFLFRAVNKKIISKYIHSILFKQFDAYELDDLFKKHKFPKASIPTQIIVAYHTGDYQKAVDLCAYLLTRKKKAKDKYKHLLILARVYFEVGDTEKLAQVVDAFDNLLSYEKNKEKVVQCYIEISFYRAYLENDLEKIEEFYHKLNESYSQIVNRIFFVAFQALCSPFVWKSLAL